MALKSTIYKFAIDLSNINENHYDSFDLTVAKHPSETVERMIVRLLAYCLNAQNKPEFTRGISSTDEPDIWCKSLDGQIELWIEVGEPIFDRVKKAAQLSRAVDVFCFNRKSDVWWRQGKRDFLGLKAQFYRFNNDEIVSLASKTSRTQHLSITIDSGLIYVASSAGNTEISLEQLDAESI
jgi:uncharacterized protein YaeQ